MRILAMTVLCVDVYPDAGGDCVGGNALNFAMQAMRSRAEATVLGPVGADKYGDRVVEYLEREGLGAEHVCRAEGRTASNRIFLSPDGVPLREEWDGGVYQTFRLSAADWAFAAAFDAVAMGSVDPNFEEAMRRLRGKLVVDFLNTRDFALMARVLPVSQLAFISGNGPTVERVQRLSRDSDTPAIVTLGAAGSVAFVRGEATQCAAERAEGVVDSTGCGDSYQAAFTVSWLRDGDVARAMKAGATAAAEIVGRLGPV